MNILIFMQKSASERLLEISQHMAKLQTKVYWLCFS